MYTRDFQERKKFEHIFYSWWSIIGTSVFLAVVLAGVAGLWGKERALKAELAELDQKIAEIKELRAKNLRKLDAIGTAEGIEEEARGKFNLKSEGEVMVVFLEDKAPKEKPKGFWEGTTASAAGIWQNLINWLRF